VNESTCKCDTGYDGANCETIIVTRLDPARREQQDESSTASTSAGIIIGSLLGVLLLAAAIYNCTQKYRKKNDEFGRNGRDRGRSRARASANTYAATEPEHRGNLVMNQDTHIYEAAEVEGSYHTIAYDTLSSAAKGNFGGDLVMNQDTHIYEAAEAEGSYHTIAYDTLSSGNFGGNLVMNQAAHIYEAAEAEGSEHTIAYDILSSAAEEQRRRSTWFTEPVATQTKAVNAAQHEKLTGRSRTNTALQTYGMFKFDRPRNVRVLNRHHHVTGVGATLQADREKLPRLLPSGEGGK
jgi:hypothetical protein